MSGIDIFIISIVGLTTLLLPLASVVILVMVYRKVEALEGLVTKTGPGKSPAVNAPVSAPNARDSI